MFVCDVPFALLFLLVVLVDSCPLLLQSLHYHIDAVVRILHDQPELMMRSFIIIIVSPYERNAVRVVEVPLDALKCRECEPTNEPTHVLELVVGFQDQKNLRAV